jgi:hypothetical protein
LVYKGGGESGGVRLDLLGVDFSGIDMCNTSTIILFLPQQILFEICCILHMCVCVCVFVCVCVCVYCVQNFPVFRMVHKIYMINMLQPIAVFNENKSNTCKLSGLVPSSV